jgi:hypothetical protein
MGNLHRNAGKTERTNVARKITGPSTSPTDENHSAVQAQLDHRPTLLAADSVYSAEAGGLTMLL